MKIVTMTQKEIDEKIDFAFDTLQKALEEIEKTGVEVWVRTTGLPPTCIRVGSDKMTSEVYDWFGYRINGKDYVHR